MTTAQPITAELNSTPSDIAAIADLARAGAEAEELELGSYYVVQGGDGHVCQIDLTGDQYRDQPRILRATVALTHVDSLLAYWDKHHDDESDVWANRERRTITAVLDAHQSATLGPDERPRWQSHRATLTLALSESMTAWLHNNGRFLDQVAFAEFCEDWMTVIAEPPAADLVEMAQQFQATTKATFKSGFKLVNGQRQLEYTEQVDASVKGDAIAVPTGMTLRIPVWRGADTAEEFTARIRYRVNHGGPGQLGIGYKLDRPTDIIDAAFEAEIDRVQQHIGRSVLHGEADA